MNYLTTNKNPVVKIISGIVERHNRKKEIERRVQILIDRFGIEQTYYGTKEIIGEEYFR